MGTGFFVPGIPADPVGTGQHRQSSLPAPREPGGAGGGMWAWPRDPHLRPGLLSWTSSRFTRQTVLEKSAPSQAPALPKPGGVRGDGPCISPNGHLWVFLDFLLPSSPAPPDCCLMIYLSPHQPPLLNLGCNCCARIPAAPEMCPLSRTPFLATSPLMAPINNSE